MSAYHMRRLFLEITTEGLMFATVLVFLLLQHQEIKRESGEIISIPKLSPQL